MSLEHPRPTTHEDPHLPVPERISLLGQEVDLYDVQPEHLKTDVPTVLAPGFSATPMAHVQNIFGLVKEGRRVLCVDTPHGLTEPAVTGLTPDEYPEVELAKLSAVVTALDEREIPVADVVAHSEGALYMAIAAHLFPGRFRNMVLVDPAGMIGKHGLWRLAKGEVGEVVQLSKDEKARPTSDTDRQFKRLSDPSIPVKVLLKDISRTAQSVKALADTDVVDVVRSLTQEGVKVSIIHGVEDKVFPMELMQKRIGPGVVTGFYSVKGGHNEIFLRPEQYTGAVDAALDALEAQRTREAQERTSM